MPETLLILSQLEMVEALKAKVKQWETILKDTPQEDIAAKQYHRGYIAAYNELLRRFEKLDHNKLKKCKLASNIRILKPKNDL